MKPARALAVLAAAFLAGAAAAAEENDLRDLRVGMEVLELPRYGYTGLACADAPGAALPDWQDYARCPADDAGRHAVRFQYDDAANPQALVNDKYEGTKVGGHPVLLTLLIRDGGRVEGLRIETDPAARLFFRKKAFLFGELAKARFGEDGWTCTGAQPTDEAQPVGGVFVQEHCEKATPTRRFVLDRALFRRPGQELREFVSRSRLEILESVPPTPPGSSG
jgi:hypothetical protein